MATDTKGGENVHEMNMLRAVILSSRSIGRLAERGRIENIIQRNG